MSNGAAFTDASARCCVGVVGQVVLQRMTTRRDSSGEFIGPRFAIDTASSVAIRLACSVLRAMSRVG